MTTPTPATVPHEKCDRCGRKGKFNVLFKDIVYPERGTLRVCPKCEKHINSMAGYERQD